MRFSLEVLCIKMATASPNLLSPGKFADLKLRNKVVMAPMTRARSGEDRVPNELMAEYYAQRASVGLVIAEATVISQQGIGWVDTPGIYNDAQIAGWRKITSELKKLGTPMILQLWHCGRASHSSFHHGNLPVAPSAVKIQGDYIHTPDGKQDYETPRALELEEISDIIEDYRKAAINAKEAGFDGVEIHSANGYLLNQFLESKTNQRTDRYGGSLENRLRLLNEVVGAVASVWDDDRIGVRLSPNGAYNDMGSPDYRETYLAAAKCLDASQIGYLHIMDGLAFGFHELGEPMTLGEFRDVYSGTIIGNCGYDQATAEQAISNASADLIAIGRPLIANPDLVERWSQGLALADDPDTSVWSAPGSEGYTDFPTHPDATPII